jgi:hypothetical protein
VYSGDRVYSRDRAAPGDRAHRAHIVDETDAFMLCGATLAFVICSLAWWLCSLCVALCERNRRNRRRQCLFDLGDEELFAAWSPHTRQKDASAKREKDKQVTLFQAMKDWEAEHGNISEFDASKVNVMSIHEPVALNVSSAESKYHKM